MKFILVLTSTVIIAESRWLVDFFSIPVLPGVHNGDAHDPWRACGDGGFQIDSTPRLHDRVATFYSHFGSLGLPRSDYSVILLFSDGLDALRIET